MAEDTHDHGHPSLIYDFWRVAYCMEGKSTLAAAQKEIYAIARPNLERVKKHRQASAALAWITEEYATFHNWPDYQKKTRSDLD